MRSHWAATCRGRHFDQAEYFFNATLIIIIIRAWAVYESAYRTFFDTRKCTKNAHVRGVTKAQTSVPVCVFIIKCLCAFIQLFFALSSVKNVRFALS